MGLSHKNLILILISLLYLVITSGVGCRGYMLGCGGYALGFGGYTFGCGGYTCSFSDYKTTPTKVVLVFLGLVGLWQYCSFNVFGFKY